MSKFFISIGVFHNNYPTEAEIAECLYAKEQLEYMANEKYDSTWEDLSDYEKRNIALCSNMPVELRNYRELGVTTPFVGVKIGHIDEFISISLANIPFEKIKEAVKYLKKLGYCEDEIVLYVGRGY